MYLLGRIILLYLYINIATGAIKEVTISKCCNLNEQLTNEQRCEKVDNPQWSLKVFSPAKKNYLPANIVPSNWHLKENLRPQCSKPTFFKWTARKYIPFQNGSVYLVEYSILIHPNQYCIDYESLMVCLVEESTSTVHVQKCCGKNAIITSTNQSCISINDSSYSIDIGPNKTLTAGFPTCKESYEHALVGKLHEADMQDNGSLKLKKSNMLLPVGNYCLEHVLENAGGSASILICQEHLPPSVTVMPTTKSSDLRFTIYPIGLALSAIFLAATLAAGALLPASHHVLHWRCQTNHVACLLVGDVLLCITHASGKMSPTPCFLIAVAMHFLFLAAFFWLNTMCFNIWWTFRDLRPQSVEKSQERFRLRLYELYAWGFPFIIAGTAAILDTLPQNSDFLRPKFGYNTCWFYGNMEILTFFIGPIGILLVVNLALFALTARELTCGLWKRELVKSTSERAALGRVCMKLVVVMGVTWIADILSWIVGGPQEIWYLTDLINCLQGVFIFIVVGCQPQVLTAIKRLWCWRKHHENGTAGTTNHHSSSSQGLPSMGDTVTNHSVTNNTSTTKSVLPLETSC